MCLQTCFLLCRIRNQTPPGIFSVPYKLAKKLCKEGASGESLMSPWGPSGQHIGSCHWGLSVLGALACKLWAGCVLLGRFSGRHEGGLISVLLTHSRLSALCDALPERESTALVRRGVA